MKKTNIALLLGDCSGVGPEVVAKYLGNIWDPTQCRIIIVGDNLAFEEALTLTKTKVDYTIAENIDDLNLESGDLLLLNVPHADYHSIAKGRINLECGKNSLKQIETVVELFNRKVISGICYAPFNKGALLDGGCPVASEMEYFAYLLGVKTIIGEINMVDNVWTTRVTSHIPIKAVSEALSIDNIVENIVLADGIIKQSGLASPRIGVAALNPHGGEGGRCGTEEIDVIGPAVARGKELGIQVSGPFSADILFMRSFKGDFDGVVTMYHDQGQIALKLKGFERSVTLGGGIPVPIGTCAHGTAFDIVGKGIASETSLKNAINIIIKMAGGENEKI